MIWIAIVQMVYGAVALLTFVVLWIYYARHASGNPVEDRLGSPVLAALLAVAWPVALPWLLIGWWKDRRSE